MKLLVKLNIVLTGILLSIFGISTVALSASELSPADRISALKAAGFSLRGKEVINECNEVADIQLKAVDLNGDGTLEAFVQDSSQMCYGASGGYLILLIKDSKGHWKKNLDCPAGDYKLLRTGHKGFPDIEIGGPGLCSPIWRWNGKKYAIYKRCAD